MEPDTSHPDNNLRITLTKKPMQEPLKISIDVTKIDKTAIYEGKKGKYLSLVVWPNKSGEDEYGNVATVKQDLGAERKGEQTPIIGNAKPLRKRQDAPAPKPQQSLKAGYDDADEVPF
jgi:hypothetical protein